MKGRLSILDRMYGLYDDIIQPFDLACQWRCSSCCTCNLTMTTLEGYSLLARAGDPDLKMLFDRAKAAAGSPRFQPQMTINTIAHLCHEGGPVPDETIDPSWGACPLLKDAACPIYRLRPFGCRCMVSSRDCRETGQAEVNEFILTVNNLFLQYIEHIDARGGTGSLIDILLYFEQPAHMETYHRTMTIAENAGLAANRPIPVLMLPPEHRTRVKPILEKFQKLGQTQAEPRQDGADH